MPVLGGLVIAVDLDERAREAIGGSLVAGRGGGAQTEGEAIALDARWAGGCRRRGDAGLGPSGRRLYRGNLHATCTSRDADLSLTYLYPLVCRSASTNALCGFGAGRFGGERGYLMMRDSVLPVVNRACDPFLRPVSETFTRWPDVRRKASPY
ncbi:hypothetical protein D3C87_1673800 [compost metagenome]